MCFLKRIFHKKACQKQRFFIVTGLLPVKFLAKFAAKLNLTLPLPCNLKY